jgi:glucose/arabinose dehydrogenase
MFRSATKLLVVLLSGSLLGIGLYLYLYRGYLTPFLPAPASAGSSLDGIKLPPGFSIEPFADRVPGARSMTRSPAGTLYVGSRKAGRVYAILDDNGDFRADRILTLAEGLNQPNGVAFRDGDLYVAEIGRILRFNDIEQKLENPPTPEVITADYPKDEHHGWKFIAFGPDDKLYIPVGIPCNVCRPNNPLYGTITRINPDGSGLEIYAHGVRNSVGFDWHPQTKALWFTDNGRDWLGENRPPDELNLAPKQGMHFGFPHCHGGDIVDPEFGADCRDFTPPAQELGPHVASLGMRFYRGTQFPQRYHNGIFIAEHGSWNRKVPIGYRVTFVSLENGKPAGYEVFAEGWLKEGAAWGRPVDIEILPDGSMLVSDDMGGRIYRITYAQ